MNRSQPFEASFRASFSASFLLGTRWFWRGLRRKEWLWLWLAVLLASSSVTFVTLLAGTVQQSMLEKAAITLGADLVVRSSRPIAPQWQQQATQLGLQTAQSLTLTTMAVHEQAGHPDKTAFQLVQLKGLSPNSPLKQGSQLNTMLSKLDTSQLIADPALHTLLNVNLQDSLTLGNRTFKIAAWLPENNGIQIGFANFAPILVIPLAEVSQLGLIGPGSRVQYELAFSGKASAIQTLANRLRAQRNTRWQILLAKAPNADLGQTLDTAWLFLNLSALATVLIAGLAILIASRFYLQQWLHAIALMRASGATTPQLMTIFATQLTWLAFLASLLGALLAVLGFQLLTPVINDYFNPLITSNALTAALAGLGSGLLALWVFALPAFVQVMSVSPMAIFRTISPPLRLSTLLISLALLSLLLLLLIQSRLMLWALPILLLVSLGLYGLAHGLLRLTRRLNRYAHGWLRVALSSLHREPGLVEIQLISLGLVMFILILLSFVRHDLLNNWQASLPANSANTFILNVQPDQKQQVLVQLAAKNIHTDLVPMVRGRLIAHNGQALVPQQQKSVRARRLLERESNVAIMAKPPAYNQIVQKMASKQPDLPPLGSARRLPTVSVELGMAKLFNIQLGDTLTFDFVGQKQSFLVMSLRKVRWQSMRLNFFYIIDPHSLSNPPISYIGQFYLPAAQSSLLTVQLAKATPGVVMINAEAMIRQVQGIMQQASLAVTLLYLFTLLSSVLVLLTAITASQQSRIRQWLLLKTLGATPADILKIGLSEFALLGALAGVFAATLAQGVSLLLSYYWLDSELKLNPFLWASAIGVSVCLVVSIGWLTQRRYLRQTPRQLVQQSAIL